MISRRNWILSSAAVAGAVQQQPASAAAAPKNIVVSSANGFRACSRAMGMIAAGADTLDAIIAGVNIVELDPEDTSVGFGGLPNEEGVVELDASVMHGPSRRAGSVAAIRNIKTPSIAAKFVMEESNHVMLVGDGALRFAKACGMPEDNLLTEKARLAWIAWKQSLKNDSGSTNWGAGIDAPPEKPKADLKRLFPNADDETLAWAWRMAKYPPTGTINCLALNARGEMSGCTSTSGLAWKIPGRVGDSPIIGAGLYVDQDVGAAGSTGRGEENIRVVGAHSIVEGMRHGMTPREACLDVLKRIARNFDNDQKRLAQFDINFYALRKDGAYGAGALWGFNPRNGRTRKTPFSVNDGGETRLEECTPLFEKREP